MRVVAVRLLVPDRLSDGSSVAAAAASAAACIFEMFASFLPTPRHFNEVRPVLYYTSERVGGSIPRYLGRAAPRTSR